MWHLASGSPDGHGKILDLGEVRVPAHERQAMLEGNRCDPNVVFRQKSPLEAEAVFQFPVSTGGLGIAGQHHAGGGELLDTGEIMLRVP
jgi:hypothetical protein